MDDSIKRIYVPDLNININTNIDLKDEKEEINNDQINNNGTKKNNIYWNYH